MILLKETKEYRVESENEAKDLMEKFRTEAHEKGYQITKCGYTHKDKKSRVKLLIAAKLFLALWYIAQYGRDLNE